MGRCVRWSRTLALRVDLFLHRNQSALHLTYSFSMLFLEIINPFSQLSLLSGHSRLEVCDLRVHIK